MKNKNIFIKFFLIINLVLSLLLSSCAHNSEEVEESNQDEIEAERSIASLNARNVIDAVIVISKVTKYFKAGITVSRSEEVKIIQENLLKYMLEGSYASDEYKMKIYKEATNYLSKVYPVLLSNLYNEANKLPLNTTTIVRPPKWTLKAEIDFLNKSVENLKTPIVKMDLIKGLTPFAFLYSKMSDAKKEKIVGKYLNELTDANWLPAVKDVDQILNIDASYESKILSLFGAVEKKLDPQFKKVRNIGAIIEKKSGAREASDSLKMVISFMDFYFKNLKVDVIKTMMSELISSGPKLTEEESMLIIFKNTGPALGKLLQQIANGNVLSPELSNMLKVLMSNGKEVPIHLVHEVVGADEGGYEIRNISTKALGTGTAAQVNKADLVWEGQERKTALRFLKPGIEKRCDDDMRILRLFVKELHSNPSLSAMVAGDQDFNKMFEKIINGLEGLLKEELEISLSVQKQKMGNEIYTRSIKIQLADKEKLLEIKVPEVYLPPSGNSRLHIQEFATGGVEFSDLNEKQVKKVVAEEMIKMWFDEALFKSGYLHADLHEGNFRVALLEDQNKIKIILYDFGLVTKLSKEEQRSFMMLGIGSSLKSPQIISEGIMAAMTSTDGKLKRTLMSKVAEEMKLNPNRSAEDWVQWTILNNYFVSDKLAALARGSDLMQAYPKNIGETEMLKDAIKKITIDNLRSAYIDRTSIFPLKKFDFIQIGSEALKSSCKSLVESFF